MFQDASITRTFGRVVLLVALVPHALAQDHSQSSGRYLGSSFTVENGLSSNVVPAVLQTQDGFLWVGTREGLLRFDGRHFTTVRFPQHALGAVYVNALAEGPDGALWIGGAEGLAEIPKQGLSQLNRVPSKLYLPGSGASNHVECLKFSRDGSLWIGTDAGLFRLQHGKVSAIILNLMISRVEEASNGHLLVITSAGFMEWDGSKAIAHPELAKRLGVKTNGIFHVFEDKHGVVWYCTQAGVARLKGNSLERLASYGIQSEKAAFRAYEDANGTIWIARHDELVRVTDSGLQVEITNVPSRFCTFDRHGDLWVGTNGAGLVKFRDRVVQMFGKADGLPGGVPESVLAASDGKLWVASNCGGLSWFDGRRFHTYADKDGLLNSCVFSLAEDSAKGILAGTYGGGVFRFHDGRFTQISKPNIQGVSVATALVPNDDGSLWIAYSDGLTRLENGQARRFTTADGLSSNQVFSVFKDRYGGIWVETSAGIDRLVQGHFVAVAPLYNAVFGEDQPGKLFALAYQGGTFQLDENRAIELKGAPPVMGLARSPSQLWFCGAGIYRAPLDSLEKWESQPDGPRDFTLFGRQDGMNSADCSNGSRNMTVTQDGRLWVATNQGVAMLQFAQTPLDSLKPSIYMEKVVVEKTVESPGLNVVLPPGTHHLELHFDVIELASPERIRFQYRMEDVDQDWSEPDANGTAIYTTIPIGTHKFHIRACNGDGVWDRQGIVYEVTEKAHYYETNLFRLIGALIVSLLLALAYRLRLDRIRSQMTVRLNERLTERTRLARELHDTLLQTVQGAKIVADSALDDPGDMNRVHSALERISDWLARATLEGRAAVSSLRGSLTQTNDLLNVLQQADQECNDGSITFTTTLEGKARDLHPIIGNEVCRIGCEAIQNACRHSNGTKVTAALHYARDLILRVEDNGVGMSSEVIAGGRKGHFGIQGMRERANRIGAKLSFSRKAAGTQVELIVPGRLAYRKDHDESAG